MPRCATINAEAMPFIPRRPHLVRLCTQRRAMRALVAELRDRLDQVAGGGGETRAPAYLARQRCWRGSASTSWSIRARRS